MDKSNRPLNGPKPTHRQRGVILLSRIKPGNQNPPPQRVRKTMRTSFLSATAQTLDYRVTPLIYSRSILSVTGTTGSVVRIRLPSSISTATPVNIPASGGAVQRTDPTKSDISTGEHLFDVQGLLPVGLQRDRHLFEHGAPLHQLASHLHRFCSHVMDRRRGADSPLLAASREDGIPAGVADSHPGHCDVREAKAQKAADGAVRGDPHRSRQEIPSAVGRDREHA